MDRRTFLKGVVGVAAGFATVPAVARIVMPETKLRGAAEWGEHQLTAYYEEVDRMGCRSDVLSVHNAEFYYVYDAQRDVTMLRVSVPINGEEWHDLVQATGYQSKEHMIDNSQKVFQRFMNEPTITLSKGPDAGTYPWKRHG